jgi:hypothetical protein
VNTSIIRSYGKADRVALQRRGVSRRLAFSREPE